MTDNVTCEPSLAIVLLMMQDRGMVTAFVQITAVATPY